MRADVLERLLELRAAGEPAVVVTDLGNGNQRLLTLGDGEGEVGEAVGKAIRDDETLCLELDGRRCMVRPYLPPRRLLVVGAVHVAQCLVRMAPVIGFEVVVIDPRQAFATEDRFPGTRLVVEWPDEGLSGLSPGRESAIVVLTHDPKLDDPALEVALRSDAFYIGALGSRRTHEARRDRLAERGFDPEDLERIHGPVGLPIGARSPGEIATSILAEIVSVRRGGAA